MAFAEDLSQWLEQQGIRVSATRSVSELSEEEDEAFDGLVRESDLIVVLGGDGSLLGASRRAAPLEKSILGIHWGTLGFLNECDPAGARDAFARIFDGDYFVEERLMLRAQIWRSGVCCCSCLALNDVAVTRNSLSRILQVEVQIGEETAASYRGDGVIIATPTGSTAHALSAGGPVLDPRVDALSITPICPHSLGGRAVVVPAWERLRIRHHTPHADVSITLDGQIGMPMQATDLVEVTRAPWKARFIRFGHNQFYPTLRDKLHWKL